MKNILIIGANGYIGSRLCQVLSEHHLVTGVDIGWFSPNTESIVMDYRELSAHELQRFDAVILLAGHSSVKTCDGPIQSAWLNNVTNFTDLLAKTRQDQLIIYASSASVYGNSQPDTPHTENNQRFVPVNNYDVTKYVLDITAENARLQGRNIIGLRFGTVNGWSPVLRTDVMINAMYETVRNSNHITITNGHISRAILGIEDLCRAIGQCLENPVPGIYNLSSFNITVQELATQLADILDIKVIDQGLVGNAYDFALSTELFQKCFDFQFQETPASILESLCQRYTESRLQRRDQYIYYEGRLNEYTPL